MINNNKGQVLLFVAVSMVIALGIGLSTSEKTISSLFRTSETDTSTRALAAAEAGAENVLRRGFSELEPSIGSTITVNIPYPNPSASARAVVQVMETPSISPITGPLNNLRVKQIFLNGYGSNEVEVCWQSTAWDPDMYYKVVRTDGSYTRGYITGVGGAGGPATTVAGGYSLQNATNTTKDGVAHSCRIVNVANAAYVRFMVFGKNTNYAVYPRGGASLPSQGLRLISKGSITVTDATPVERSVQVDITKPYISMPVFDFALFSENGDITAGL